MASIADRSNCSRWLHSKCQTHFDSINFYLTIPSIIVSTVAGSATIGMPGLVTDPGMRNYVTTIVGIFTLSSGLLTSINQYMKTAQLAESHRISSVAYGKLHRIISSELALRRDQRLNALDFMRSVRSEQDRLQDSSSAIIDSVIALFRKEFDENKTLEKPEIAGDLDHVEVNRSIKGIATRSQSSSASVQPSPQLAILTPLRSNNPAFEPS